MAGPWEDYQTSTADTAVAEAEPPPWEDFKRKPWEDFAPPPQVQDVVDQSKAQQAIERNPQIPQWVNNAAAAAIDTAKGFIPTTVGQAAQMLTPVASAPHEIAAGIGAVKDWLAGKPIDQINVERFPEGQLLVEAEKTPPGSKERFQAGFDVITQMLMAKGIAGHLGRRNSGLQPDLSDGLAARRTPPAPPIIEAAETRLPIESTEIPGPAGVAAVVPTAEPGKQALDTSASTAIDPAAVEAANIEGIKAIAAEETKPSRRKAKPLTAEEEARRDYEADLVREAQEFQGSTGLEFKEAIEKLGGLPSRASPHRTAEIHDLEQTILNPQRTERIAPNRMFRANAQPLDRLAQGLRDEGFDVAGPNELYDLLNQRFGGATAGKLIFGTPELAAAEVFKPKGKSIKREGVEERARAEVNYARALSEHNAASKEFRDAQIKYRAREIGDNEFLTARTKFEQATARYDAAFTAAQKAGVNETPDLTNMPFSLSGETGIDWEAASKQAAVEAKAKAEAEAVQAEQQGSLFKPKQQATLPRQITPTPLLPVNSGIPVAEADIRQYLSKSLDIPVRAGMRIAGGMRGAEGVFRVKPETIRTKLRNDIPTIAHEVGHYLHHLLLTDATTGRPSAFAGSFDHELLALGSPTSLPTYSVHQVRMEGVAEYLAKFLSDPPAAIAATPNFSTFFEAQLRSQFPQTWEIVSNARDQVQRFLSQPGWEKARSRIVFDPKQPRVTFRQYLSRKYTEWFNELAPIDRAVNKLVEFGLDPAIAEQVSNRAINYKGGWRGKADFDLEFDQTNINGERVGPGLKQILKGLEPKELGDFSTYIALKRAIEKVSQGIKTGFEPELSDGKTHKKLKDLAPRYEMKRRQLIQYSENLLKMMEQSGYFTPPQMAMMGVLNRDYVPFYRVYEGITGTSTGPKGAAGGFVNTSSGVLRMKGSDRQIIDPLESIIKNTYMFRDLAERNRVGREFVAAVEQTQGGGRVGESVLKPMKPTQVSGSEVAEKVRDVLGIDVSDAQANELALTIWRASNGTSAKEGIFRIWKDGEEKLFQVDDPDLLRALSLSDTIDANAVRLLPGFKPLSQITKFLRVGATLTPEFIVRNPFRDQVTAGVFSRFGFVPFFDGFRGLLSAIKKDHWYQDWVKSGGRYSGLYDVEGGNLRATLERTIHDPNALQLALGLIDPRNVLRNLATASSLMEESTRISEFRRAMRSGADPLAAANASKDVTLNFSRSGLKGKILNQLVAFFNAGMQDVDKLIRAHKERPVSTVAKAFMYISVPSILTWMAGKDDPEIQNLPTWRKSFFWNLNIKGNVFSFPKPFLLGALYGTSVEKALDYANGRDPNALQKALSAIYQNTFIRSDLIAATNAFKPLIEDITNYSFFTGRPLISESQRGLSPGLQFNPSTSETAKFVGNKLGVAPIFIDNMVRGYFGGLGKYGTDAIDWFILKAQGDDAPKPPARDVSQLPVIRAFMRPPYEPSEYVPRFYRSLERAETRLNDFRTYGNRLDGPGMRAFAVKNRNELVWYNAGVGKKATVITELRRARDYMSDLNKAIVIVQQSRNISPEDKARKIIALGNVRDKVAETSFKTYVHPSDRQKEF